MGVNPKYWSSGIWRQNVSYYAIRHLIALPSPYSRIVKYQAPESGCIVGGAAAAGRPESAGGVDEAAEHQLAGDERKQRDENFLQRRKVK